MIKNLLLTLFAVLCTVFSANAAGEIVVVQSLPAGPFTSGSSHMITYKVLEQVTTGPPPTFAFLNTLVVGSASATFTGPVASATTTVSGGVATVTFVMNPGQVTGTAFNINFMYGAGGSSYGSTTLPIELSRFGANVANSNVNLAWETLTETNNEKFLVERSFNGKDFSTIAELAGAGTTLARKNYSFEDKTATATEYKVAYYRLKNVSYDGKASVSQLVAVKLRDANTATITSIAPSKSYLSFTIEENTDVTVSIFNLNGQAITSKVIAAEKGLNQADIDFSNLEQGMYIVNLKTNTSSVSKKFVY